MCLFLFVLQGRDGKVTLPSSLSSSASTPVLSVNSFTLTPGRGWVVVKSPWVPHLKDTTNDTPEVGFHDSAATHSDPRQRLHLQQPSNSLYLAINVWKRDLTNEMPQCGKQKKDKWFKSKKYDLGFPQNVKVREKPQVQAHLAPLFHSLNVFPLFLYQTFSELLFLYFYITKQPVLWANFISWVCNGEMKRDATDGLKLTPAVGCVIFI